MPVGHCLVSFPVAGYSWQLAAHPSGPLSSHTGSQISKFIQYTDLTAVLQHRTLRSQHEEPLGQGTTIMATLPSPRRAVTTGAFLLWPVGAFECGAEIPRPLRALTQPLVSDLLRCATLNALYAESLIFSRAL